MATMSLEKPQLCHPRWVCNCVKSVGWTDTSGWENFVHVGIRVLETPRWYLRDWWPPRHNDGRTPLPSDDNPVVCIKGFVGVGLVTEHPTVPTLFIFPPSYSPLGFYGPGTYSSCCHLSQDVIRLCKGSHTHTDTHKPIVRKAASPSVLISIYFSLLTCIVIIHSKTPMSIAGISHLSSLTLTIPLYMFISPSLYFSHTHTHTHTHTHL